jgi:hypothetical protein
MLLLRGLGASLLWIVAGVVGLLGALLSVTVILAPVGIPLLLLARKIFGYSMVVLFPGKVRHPVQHTEKSAKGGLKRMFGKSKSVADTGKRHGRKARKKLA